MWLKEGKQRRRILQMRRFQSVGGLNLKNLIEQDQKDLHHDEGTDWSLTQEILSSSSTDNNQTDERIELLQTQLDNERRERQQKDELVKKLSTEMTEKDVLVNKLSNEMTETKGMLSQLMNQLA
ncbi:hypothetical protein Tco_0685986 [Tanacetum coccineum]